MDRDDHVVSTRNEGSETPDPAPKSTSALAPEDHLGPMMADPLGRPYDEPHPGRRLGC